MEVRGELVELVLSCCVGMGCTLVGRLHTHTSAFTHCPLLLCCCARTLRGRKGLFQRAGYSLSLREGTWRQEQNEKAMEERSSLTCSLWFAQSACLHYPGQPFQGWHCL